MMGIITFSAIYVVLKLRHMTRRRWWIRLVNRSRNEKGFHLLLFRELKTTDHEEFFFPIQECYLISLMIY